MHKPHSDTNREKEPSRRLIFVQCSLFLFWLRADGGLAFCRGVSLLSFVIWFRESEWVYSRNFKFTSFSIDCSFFRAMFSSELLLCFSCLVDCFSFVLTYIWGNTVLNTCMAFVVIKIMFFVNSVFNKILSSVTLSLCVIITVGIIHNTKGQKWLPSSKSQLGP